MNNLLHHSVVWLILTVCGLALTHPVEPITILKPDAVAMPADASDYLCALVDEFTDEQNSGRTFVIVSHGHSVPAGHTQVGFADTAASYPRQLSDALAVRYPMADIRVVCTAIGSENSVEGAARFERDVLSKNPDLITIDYGLNDRFIGLAAAERAWVSMIRAAKARGIPVLLLTPTLDTRRGMDQPGTTLADHANQIRRLAAEYDVGLVDSHAAFKRYCEEPGHDLSQLMATVNHPNRHGHELVANELLRQFH